MLKVQGQSYDNLNRLNIIVYADSTTISYAYDAVGNRITETVQTSHANSLPIELVYFNAAKDNCTTYLAWQTATEINNSHFEVEHSMDAATFSRITIVEGAGNAVQEQFYSYEHQTPQKGVNYYRLKQVDTDGTVNYSKIKAVSLPECFSEGMHVYPNPTHSGEVYVDINALGSVKRLEVFNALGQRIESPQITKMNDQRWHISTTMWSPGTYNIKAIFEDGHALVKTFVVGK